MKIKINSNGSIEVIVRWIFSIVRIIRMLNTISLYLLFICLQYRILMFALHLFNEKISLFRLQYLGAQKYINHYLFNCYLVWKKNVQNYIYFVFLNMLRLKIVHTKWIWTNHVTNMQYAIEYIYVFCWHQWNFFFRLVHKRWS